MNIRVILEWDEEVKAFSATCPELNYISSCGDTTEEAVANLKEAIQLLLEPMPDHFLNSQQIVNTIEVVI
ncbi:type II toxin-antitoxin system HicB family antitoxin [Crocosphaera sp. XPORK-15E]|uniref:type II toxin-antitoxin system HicB family antitoxin n=1 Tax=Crocosphaera sp. XPORK-15E TaxID=3110247 RepID=UPI002B21753F|nr:type II toxin-antitoxin system HicB family antitoxin [Crocosphaera sp. XPORK-15E]MEA5535243.1 type II toxin-antitoxin system HicB family antitoxin [Crocosphaera sp. XPORK-15E]